MVLVTIFTVPAAANFDFTCASTFAQSDAAPASIGPATRCLSYKESTEASTMALTLPLVIGESSFPSILIGRPSLVFTTIDA